MNARDKPLVFQLGYAIEGVQDDVSGEESETRTVHDKGGISILCIDGCARDTWNATTMISHGADFKMCHFPPLRRYVHA